MYGVALRRLDPARNMARFYAVTVQPTLFGQWALVRRWGRINTDGRRVESGSANSRPRWRRRRTKSRPSSGAAISPQICAKRHCQLPGIR